MKRALVVGFVVGLALALALALACGGKPACGPGSCHGCCDSSGACQTGTALSACGTGGFACSPCTLQQICSAGTCTSLSGAGGGSGGGSGGGAGGGNGGGVGGGGVATNVGAPCTQNSDCHMPDGGGLCGTAAAGWPGGYCTNGCYVDADCGAGAQCANAKSCGQTCSAPGAGQSTCRAQYVCGWPNFDDGGLIAVCIPDCRVSPVVCGSTKTCGSDGYCH